MWEDKQTVLNRGVSPFLTSSMACKTRHVGDFFLPTCMCRFYVVFIMQDAIQAHFRQEMWGIVRDIVCGRTNRPCLLWWTAGKKRNGTWTGWSMDGILKGDVICVNFFTTVADICPWRILEDESYFKSLTGINMELWRREIIHKFRILIFLAYSY